MICIHYNNGRVLQGVVLAFGNRLVRVAVEGSEDAVEFKLINQVWVSEDCEVVKLHFVDFTQGVAPEECEEAGSEDADLLDSLLHFRSQPASLRRVM
jgi:hypothetical protein